MCTAPASGKSSKPRVVADASYIQGLIEAPVPNYPAQAAQNGWSGIGVFEIRFRGGAAERVNVVLTTGHRLLDDTARAALLRWRCQPRAQNEVRMTMAFTKGNGLVKVAPPDENDGEARKNLSRADRPRYPYEARRQGWGGYGEFVIRFDESGSATQVVTLKSTGHIILDNEAMATFRDWRCAPGVYTTIIVPLTFTAPRSRLR